MQNLCNERPQYFTYLHIVYFSALFPPSCYPYPKCSSCYDDGTQNVHNVCVCIHIPISHTIAPYVCGTCCTYVHIRSANVSQYVYTFIYILHMENGKFTLWRWGWYIYYAHVFQTHIKYINNNSIQCGEQQKKDEHFNGVLWTGSDDIDIYITDSLKPWLLVVAHTQISSLVRSSYHTTPFHLQKKKTDGRFYLLRPTNTTVYFVVLHEKCPASQINKKNQAEYLWVCVCVVSSFVFKYFFMFCCLCSGDLMPRPKVRFVFIINFCYMKDVME